MSTWTVGASIFFSVSLFSSAYEAAHVSFAQLAAAGNPQAIQQGLADLASRVGGVTFEMPALVAEAGAVAVPQAAPARLAPEISWALSKGKRFDIQAGVPALLGLGDGASMFPTIQKGWQDDNDNTIHYFLISGANNSDILISWQPADKSKTVTWRTAPSGKLLGTVQTDTDPARSVPNATYSTLYASELVYWDKLVPAEFAAGKK
jgi:uncharacterized protein YfiM (DUF2279 family)